MTLSIMDYRCFGETSHPHSSGYEEFLNEPYGNLWQVVWEYRAPFFDLRCSQLDLTPYPYKWDKDMVLISFISIPLLQV